MALIKCTECKNEISDKANYCPKCGKEINVLAEKRLCKEFGQKIESATGVCTNCGYDLEKIRKKKKKILFSVGIFFVVVTLIIGFFLFINANKGSKYIMEACEELSDEENGLPDIEEIYISEEIAENSLIDYVYRVYIEYEGRWGTEKVLYIVDDEGKTYFATEYGDDKLVNYLTLAEFEVNGIEGIFEPSDEWEELSYSKVRKIEKKFD